MGVINHNAIIVIGFDDSVDKARDLAIAEGLIVTNVVNSPANGYRSFMIAPDGSKEGWETSDEFNEKRENIKTLYRNWIKNSDTFFIEFIEVAFGEINENGTIVDVSNYN